MRPALTRKATPVLNNRQQHYLPAAYQLDQAIELQRKRNFARGMVEDARTPAAEWRAMPYGRWQHKPGQPPTPLREALNLNLVSPGTGSTWKALAERGLVEVDDRTIQFPGMLLREQYELPHVSLTRAGRKLARELLGEVRETAKLGILAPDIWRALAWLWAWPPAQERYLLADGNGAEWSSYQLWCHVRLEKGRPSWQVPARAISVEYQAVGQIIRLYFSDYRL